MKVGEKLDGMREEMREKVDMNNKITTGQKALKDEMHAQNEKVDLADQVKLEIKAEIKNVKDEVKTVRDEVKGDILKLNEKVG